MMNPAMLVVLLAAAQPGSAPIVQTPTDVWKAAEQPFLSGHVQLTFPDRFARAGEQYFDHQASPQWVIFQAIERPKAGVAAESNYAMFAAKLKRDSATGKITGIEEPALLSPPGSANTCGWFHPTQPGTAIFGSTLVAPASTDSPGYSRDRQRYSWQFPKEMEVVKVGDIARLGASTSFEKHAQEMASKLGPASSLIPKGERPVAKPEAIFARPGYDAECSYSADGRLLLYTHVDPTNNDPNLWIMDTKTGKHTPIVTARGYDGGPFFSPDGKWICYRSDRKGNNVLQLFLGEIAFGDDGDAGAPIGLAREIQITFETPGKEEREQAVSWCPYFHPSGKYLVYATSEVGHSNYEVFAIDIAPIVSPAEGQSATDPRTTPLRKARITHAEGFDGLPVFSADGKTMIWTSQRGPKREGEERPSSQMWVADVVGEPAWGK